MTSVMFVADRTTDRAPLFSVLVPTHYRADVIGLAIRSVLAQQEQDFEILVAGDGAEPGTAEAVLACADPRIRWFDLPKTAGFGYATRNIALRAARGRYIAFMADDDLFFPDHLRLLRNQLDAGAMIACTRAAWVSSDGIAAPFSNCLALADEFEVFRTSFNSLPASCFAYRRDALDDPAPWPEDSPGSGDLHLWRRILAAHPTRPLGVDPTYGVLHFAARRRDLRFAGMPDFKVLLDIADHADWWPAPLRADLSSGRPEQAWYFDRLSQPEGARLLRDALSRVTDRLAWELVQSRLPEGQRRIRLTATSAQSEAATEVPGDFDPALYLELHPDVAQAGMDAADHWLRHGQFEHRAYHR